MKMNIVVCGKKGSGKTSLIHAVCKKDAVTDGVSAENGADKIYFQIHQTPVADFVDIDCEAKTLFENGENSPLLAVIESKLKSKNGASQVHAIWNCIDGSDPSSVGIMTEFSAGHAVNILTVVTKSDAMSKEQSESIFEPCENEAENGNIFLASSVTHAGLKRLMMHSFALFESVEKDNFEFGCCATLWNAYCGKLFAIWDERLNNEADSCISWASGRAAAIAAIPLPLADIAPLSLNEAYMIWRIAGVYGHNIDKSGVAMILGMAGGSIAGKVCASLLPFLKIPIAAGVTYAVGKTANAYYASNTTFEHSRKDDC